MRKLSQIQLDIEILHATSRAKAGKFPVFFPVSREFAAESGSQLTPSTATNLRNQLVEECSPFRSRAFPRKLEGFTIAMEMESRLLADRWGHRVSILGLTLVPVRIRDSRVAGVIQFRYLLRRQPPPLRSDVLHQLFFIARPNNYG